MLRLCATLLKKRKTKGATAVPAMSLDFHDMTADNCQFDTLYIAENEDFGNTPAAPLVPPSSKSLLSTSFAPKATRTHENQQPAAVSSIGKTFTPVNTKQQQQQQQQQQQPTTVSRKNKKTVDDNAIERIRRQLFQSFGVASSGQHSNDSKNTISMSALDEMLRSMLQPQQHTDVDHNRRNGNEGEKEQERDQQHQRQQNRVEKIAKQVEQAKLKVQQERHQQREQEQAPPEVPLPTAADFEAIGFQGKKRRRKRWKQKKAAPKEGGEEEAVASVPITLTSLLRPSPPSSTSSQLSTSSPSLSPAVVNSIEQRLLDDLDSAIRGVSGSPVEETQKKASQQHRRQQQRETQKVVTKSRHDEGKRRGRKLVRDSDVNGDALFAFGARGGFGEPYALDEVEKRSARPTTTVAEEAEVEEGEALHQDEEPEEEEAAATADANADANDDRSALNNNNSNNSSSIHDASLKSLCWDAEEEREGEREPDGEEEEEEENEGTVTTTTTRALTTAASSSSSSSTATTTTTTTLVDMSWQLNHAAEAPEYRMAQLLQHKHSNSNPQQQQQHLSTTSTATATAAAAMSTSYSSGRRPSKPYVPLSARCGTVYTGQIALLLTERALQRQLRDPFWASPEIFSSLQSPVRADRVRTHGVDIGMGSGPLHWYNLCDVDPTERYFFLLQHPITETRPHRTVGKRHAVFRDHTWQFVDTRYLHERLSYHRAMIIFNRHPEMKELAIREVASKMSACLTPDGKLMRTAEKRVIGYWDECFEELERLTGVIENVDFLKATSVGRGTSGTSVSAFASGGEEEDDDDESDEGQEEEQEAEPLQGGGEEEGRNEQASTSSGSIAVTDADERLLQTRCADVKQRAELAIRHSLWISYTDVEELCLPLSEDARRHDVIGKRKSILYNASDTEDPGKIYDLWRGKHILLK